MSPPPQQTPAEARPPAADNLPAESPPASDRFYESALRLRAVFVEKRDAVLAAVNITTGQYYADPRQYRPRIQCQLRLQGRNLADWDEGLGGARLYCLVQPPGPSSGGHHTG